MKKVEGWKTNQLSFACRVLLEKSVLEEIPIYHMMPNILPKACIEDIHRFQRNFIWGIPKRKGAIMRLVGI